MSAATHDGHATRSAPWRAWGAGLLALAGTSALLLFLREDLDKAHVALAYLLVVLGGSAAGGRTLGVVLALLAFLAFDVLFLPPYGTLVVRNPVDWLVLLAFLATGLVAAQLLYRSQREAARARERASEVDRLAALGAETLGAGTAAEALAAIARAMRTTIGVASCDIYTWDAERAALQPATPGTGPAPELVQWVAAAGRGITQGEDGTSRVAPGTAPAEMTTDAPSGTRALLIPLVVRDRVVGALRLSDPSRIALDTTRRRYLEALAHYAALGVERMRLAAEAERAAALREADRLKDSLLAAVSHDLRTPLTSIRGVAQSIAEGGDERAHVIEAEVDRLNRLVADLLDLSRLAGGGMPVRVGIQAAEDLVGAALQGVEGLAGAARIVVHLDTTEPVLVGRFDLGLSLRVLGNLLDNALKYGAPGTPVELSVRRDGGMLAFAVADRGPGVPETERERIFAPFYRPPGAPSDVAGAGLGLAIARGLADAQGGSLSLAPRDGGGSVFTLRLPAAELAEAAFTES